ncbi:uncharacterized protein DEA37_0005614, partial [Paragonimus westermani]
MLKRFRRFVRGFEAGGPIYWDPTPPMTTTNNVPIHCPLPPAPEDMNKYAHLLQVIEEMGRDIKPTYANNKNAAERLKKNIHTARILVRECVSELE